MRSSFLSLSQFVILVVIVSIAEAATPFVSGFERFGRHDDVDDSLAGEVVVSELSCTACHASKSQNAKGGPQLRSIARRVTDDWLRDYLNAPSVIKPGTTMPDVLANLDSDEKTKAIESLIAFLSTKRAGFPKIKAGGANPVEFEFWTKGNHEHGIDLYHESGCVACHAPDPEFEVAELPASPLDALLDELDPEELHEMGLAGAARRVESVPHGDLLKKYSRESLTRFLYDPVHFRPGGRMPNMKLTVSEAADIAEYLLHESDVASHSMTRCEDEALIQQGQAYFQSLGCANCHQAGVDVTVQSIPLNQLKMDSNDVSCLDDPSVKLANNKSADYGLDEVQVNAIKSFIEGQQQEPKIAATMPDASHVAATTMLQMNCYGCHERDELGGVGRYRKGYFETAAGVDLGDEGRLPPPLTGVGRKLKASWMKRVVKGDKNTTLRSHMTIRMPVFSHPDVMKLVDELGELDGVEIAGADQVFGSVEKIASAGQGLMEIGCIQCHVFDGQAMPGVIGVDLTGVPDRIHPSWFRDFISNPGASKKRTRMPTFFPDGKSQVTDVLDGDADRQIAAMWAYLTKLEEIGIPTKIAAERAKNYELKPSEQPLVLRTFMNDVGMHAIAVGFPSGTHFAFDADQCRLAVAWRESFLDARSTWFERLSPPIDPLGLPSEALPAGNRFYQVNPDDPLATPIKPRFLGYRLDQGRVPTFRYRCGDYVIEDRITPDETGGLKRVLTCEISNTVANDSSHAVWFHVAKNETDTEELPERIPLGSKLTIQVKGANIQTISTDDGSQWMVPLVGGQTWEVQYRW